MPTLDPVQIRLEIAYQYLLRIVARLYENGWPQSLAVDRIFGDVMAGTTPADLHLSKDAFSEKYIIPAAWDEGGGPGVFGVSGEAWPQDIQEISAFRMLLRLKGVKRYLEIGSRNGDTFHYIVSALGPDAWGVAVDWPGHGEGEATSLQRLTKTVAALPAKAIVGSSQDEAVIFAVNANGPYDAILIDGDHTYEGVMADWRVYGQLAPIVAFHDIANALTGVPEAWDAVSYMTKAEVIEIITPASSMGIGVLIKHAA